MTIPKDGDELMTLRQCGEELRRGPNRMRHFVAVEGLPARKIGGRNFVLRSDFEEWRSRPEIVLMLTIGDRIQTGIRGERIRAREHATA